MRVLTLPNLITIARILTVPVIIYFIIAGEGMIAFVLFVIAGISDAADGILARVFGWRSRLGAMLDPMADKVLITGVYLALSAIGILPVWLVLLVVLRDVFIVLGFSMAWLWKKPFDPHARFISKLNTAVQITLAATALAHLAFAINLEQVIDALTVLCAATTLASFALYAVLWRKHIWKNGQIEG